MHTLDTIFVQYIFLTLLGFKFTFLEKIMAEASATPHWRSWRNLQVIWLIDEVYNTFWEATKFNTKRLLDLGDELDDESLFHFSLSFPSWKTLKEATGVDKKELFKLLKLGKNFHYKDYLYEDDIFQG